jgi:hypothetical protein
MKVYLEPDEVAMMEKASSNLRDKLLIRTLFLLFADRLLACIITRLFAGQVPDGTESSIAHENSVGKRERLSPCPLRFLECSPWGAPLSLVLRTLWSPQLLPLGI